MSQNPATYQVQDASLSVEHILPANKSLSTDTDGLDLGPLTGISARVEECELLLTYPALLLAQLPNTSVITYTIQASNDPTFETGVEALATTSQTGAAGTASQPGGQLRCKIPTDCGRYVRADATTDVNGADCSAASLTLQIVF
jgi:hypothetical protein